MGYTHRWNSYTELKACRCFLIQLLVNSRFPALTHELHQRASTLTLMGSLTHMTDLCAGGARSKPVAKDQERTLASSESQTSSCSPPVMTRCVKYSTGTWHFFSDALGYAFNAWRASLPSLTYKLWKVAIQTFSAFSEPPLEHGWFYIYSVTGTGTRPIHTTSHLKTERQKRPPILLPF